MQTIDVQVYDSTGVDDYTVVLSHAEVSVAEVFEALGLSPAEAVVDGRRIESPATTPAAQVIARGGQLACADHALLLEPREPAPPAEGLEVAVVAGLDAGAITHVSSGLHKIGDANDAGWYVDVAGQGVGAASPWHQNAPAIEAVVNRGTVLGLGAPIRIEPLHGRVVHRPPRYLAAEAVEPVTLPVVPEAIKPAAPLSWVTLLAPVPIAVLMAVFFRPIFALFAAMGPVMALGRWYESRRRFRRDSRIRCSEVEAMSAATSDAVTEYLELEAQRRWLAHPHIAELWRRSRGWSVRLWERRYHDVDFLDVTVGIAPDLVTVATQGAPFAAEVHGSASEPQQVRAVPHTVDLLANQGIGFFGERPSVIAAARAVVLQLASLHGPADVRIGVVVAAGSAVDWDWVKWLPHHDSALSATSAKPVASALATPRDGSSRRPAFSSADRHAESVDLIVVDAIGCDVAAMQRAATDSGRVVRFVVLAEHSTRLPAACSGVMAVAPTVGELAAPELGGRRQLVVPVGISAEAAHAWARSMASLIDPELVEFSRVYAEGVSLLGLLGPSSAESIAEQWVGRPVDAPPVATVGVSDDAAFSIDLVHDGPHALVAGTTGSGKSELLRTLVLSLAASCPPDQLNFVLIDFKGGGAFDAVDQLPHVVGLITDLDEALVVRAISSMRAELQRRELLFRKLGVSDFERACVQASEPLARLVVVIDEFAVLAADYAELMAALVDLAARGRSLGMHLVLATQRPSGVVDQKIRANTNLRIALRVQDVLDSQDVVGIGDAAAIDRTSPGRAIVSVGGDTPVSVQTAYTGAPDPRSQGCEIRRHSLLAAEELQTAQGETAGNNEARREGAAQTELAILAEAVIAASATRPVRVRPLWTAPLPECLDWIDLGSRLLAEQSEGVAVADGADGAGGIEAEQSSLALGLVDVPEEQAQLPWRWVLDSGPLAIYGADPDCGAKLLMAVGAALASRYEPDALHLYVIDGDGRGAGQLAELPHTGAYVTLAETDRIDRVIRLFESALDERRMAPAAREAPAARMVLAIENLASVLAARDELAAASIVDRLGGLARDGSKHGLHLVIAARAVREIGHRLAQQIPNRLVMELADPSSYLVLGLKAHDVVALPPMRAIDLATRRLVQLVEPPDLSSWSTETSESGRGWPRGVGTFPTTVDHQTLKLPTLDNDGVVSVPIGIESVDLAEAVLHLQPAEHALVVGGPGMGRSEFCYLLAAALRPTPIEVFSVMSRRATTMSPYSALDITVLCDPVSIDGLASSGRRTVVLVDDAEHVDENLAAALERLVANRTALVSVVATSSFEFARGHRSWTRGIRSGGTGVLLGASATDGDLLRVRLGPLDGGGVLPGRGHLVRRGQVQGMQTARCVR